LAIANLEHHQPILKRCSAPLEPTRSCVKSKKAEYFPTLSAFFRYNYKGSSDDYFIGDSILFNYSAVGLNMQIPLFMATGQGPK